MPIRNKPVIKVLLPVMVPSSKKQKSRSRSLRQTSSWPSRQAEGALAQAQAAEEKQKARAEIAQTEWKAVIHRLQGNGVLASTGITLVLVPSL